MDKIRNLELKDFYAHIKICLSKELAEKEFQVMLAGGGNTKSKNNMKHEFPNKQQQSSVGTQRQTKKAMSFSSKIRKVKITKPPN